MTFAIRQATLDDHPTIARLFPELRVPDPVPTRETLAAILPHVVIAEDGDSAKTDVGYAAWRLLGKTCHVIHVIADPHVRKRGVGRLLMEAVRDRAIAAGCKDWYLNVKKDNAPAIALYERCGMEKQSSSWSLQIRWAEMGRLPSCSTTEPFEPEAKDDAAIAKQLSLPSEFIALARAREGTKLMALREHDRVVGFAAFDPRFPGLYPFRVARPNVLRPLFEAARIHADLATFDYVRMMVEGDLAANTALIAAGANVVFEIVRMGAPLR